MTLHFRREAENDLIAIYRESIDQFGIAQAERYRTRLDQAFALIDASPRLARLRIEYDPPIRVYPVGAHIVVYSVQPDGLIEIIRIRHGREDWSADPAGEN